MTSPSRRKRQTTVQNRSLRILCNPLRAILLASGQRLGLCAALCGFAWAAVQAESFAQAQTFAVQRDTGGGSTPSNYFPPVHVAPNRLRDRTTTPPLRADQRSQQSINQAVYNLDSTAPSIMVDSGVQTTHYDDPWRAANPPMARSTTPSSSEFDQTTAPGQTAPRMRSVMDPQHQQPFIDNSFTDPSLDLDDSWTEPPPSRSSPMGSGHFSGQPLASPIRSRLPARQVNEFRQDEPGPDDAGCESSRRELLNNPIVNIALDISPPPRTTGRGVAKTLERRWLDRFGNPMVTGQLLDMRRGYLIIKSNRGTERIAFSRVSEADLAAIAEYWDIPAECLVSTDYFQDRCWVPQMVHWHASSLCHKTLFFEDVNLERYGHSAGPVMQPLRSTAHFFVSLLSVPYQAGIHPPNECQYALGYYRPGNCAPWLRDPVPISLNGALYQASVITGGAFILP